MKAERAIKWYEGEICRLKAAPGINGCSMQPEWEEQIEVHSLAIAALRAQQVIANQSPCINCGVGWGSANANGVTTCEETCEKFAAYMAQQERESNKPLTMDELREMDGEPVWVVQKRGYADGDYGYCVMNNFIAEVPGISHTWFDLEDYGKTWLAYRHKPKEV